MTDFLVGVAAAVAATALLAAALYAYRRAKLWYRFRPFRKIWQPFATLPTEIVLTGKRQGHTIKVSVSETDAVESIRYLLSANKEVSQLVSESDSIRPEGHNIITLGSATANEVTQALLRSLSGALDHSYTADNDLIVNGEVFRSQYANNILVRDYALVCKANNPFSESHKFLVFAGNHGIGTQGAVLAITSPEHAGDIIRKVGSSDFYAVIETEIEQRFGRSPAKVVVKRCGLLARANGHPVETVLESRETRLRDFLVQQGADESHLTHVTQRANLGVRIGNAIEANGGDVDLDAIYFGAMLHDIGHFHSPSILHGIRGAEIVVSNRKLMMEGFALGPETFAKICEAIECHVVGGLRRRWIEEAKLPLPARDYVPQTLEAKIVAFCDQVLHNRHESDSILVEAPQFDNEIRRQFYILTCDITEALFQQAQTETNPSTRRATEKRKGDG
jgi:HD superfamily phosphodiesterase